MWWERRDRTNVWVRWKHLAAFMRLTHLRFQTLTLFYQRLIINPLTRLKKDFDLSLFTLTNVRGICHLAWSIEAVFLFFLASLKRDANSMSTASTLLCQNWQQQLAQICFMVSFTLKSLSENISWEWLTRLLLGVTNYDATDVSGWVIRWHHRFSSSNRCRNLPRSARKSNWLCVKQESQRILDTWTMRTSR